MGHRCHYFSLLFTLIGVIAVTALLSVTTAGHIWNRKALGYDAFGYWVGRGMVAFDLYESDTTIGVAPGTFLNPRFPSLLPRYHADNGGFVWGVQRRGVSIPLWIFVAPLMLWQYRTARRNRPRPGHCPQCSYDMALLESSTCPECGAKIPLRNAEGEMLDVRPAHQARGRR